MLLTAEQIRVKVEILTLGQDRKTAIEGVRMALDDLLAMQARLDDRAAKMKLSEIMGAAMDAAAPPKGGA